MFSARDETSVKFQQMQQQFVDMIHVWKCRQPSSTTRPWCNCVIAVGILYIPNYCRLPVLVTAMLKILQVCEMTFVEIFPTSHWFVCQNLNVCCLATLQKSVGSSGLITQGRWQWWHMVTIILGIFYEEPLSTGGRVAELDLTFCCRPFRVSDVISGSRIPPVVSQGPMRSMMMMMMM